MMNLARKWKTMKRLTTNFLAKFRLEDGVRVPPVHY